MLDALRKLGKPITREAYLRFDLCGEVPEHLDAEYLASMPPELREPKAI